MFIGKLDQSHRVEAAHPAFKLLFDFVKNTNFDTLPKGKVEVDCDRVYIMNLDIDGADRAAQPLEMHRRYIDVHILLGGEEAIG